MTLATGSRLGPYEILAPLGAGGMGEVYRARDTRLGREVAVKTLPEQLTRDTERLERFEREAKVLAALNHPNIAAIYGLEESGETRLLVLELVPGETLAEKLAAGPLPVEEALATCRQIAEALEAAHEKGIIHRDLKPSNVKVTPAGKVKVLDFGLAKAFGAEPSRGGDVSHSPTVTSGGTQKGVILGTAAYMSPEQARGKPVDRRTDIWSFGCVLHEALSGRKAFEGETVSDVMASVLTREPDWKSLPAQVPPRVRDLQRRCLQKDPERRLHDIADARLEIEDAGAEPAAAFSPTATPRPGGAPIGLLAVAALGAAALASLATWQLARRAAVAGGPEVTKLARITHDPGRSEWPSWSPDGSLLAYSSDRSGDFEIYVRRRDAGQDVNVTNHPGQDIQPAFSPDGNSIAFISTRSSRTGLIKIGGVLAYNSRTYGGDLWVVPALGGAARRLAPDANYPVWRPDGRGILYISGVENRRSILEVSTDGGAPRTILASQESSWEIQRIACSPDGRWLSFEAELEGIFLMPVLGGKPRTLLSGMSHAWDSSSGRIYFVTRNPQGGSRVQFVEIGADGAPRGAPRTVGLMTAFMRDVAVSPDGRRIVVSDVDASRNLTRLPLAPGGGAPTGPEEALSVGRVTDGYPNVSPDGRRIAYVSDVLGLMRVWILDLESQRRERLQLPGEDIGQVTPVWMPSGREIVLSRRKPESGSRWIAATDGSRAEELVGGTTEGACYPSPDGRKLLYSKASGGVRQLFLFDFRSRESVQLTKWLGDKADAVWSPDGRWIGMVAIKDGVMQLFRMPSSGGAAQQLTTGYERMRHPFYSPDGRWIYIQPSHRNICRVPAEGGALQQVTPFPEAGLFLEEPTISPDGRYLYYCRSNGGSSLWLMTLEDRDRARD
ncbi:MAG TPA: protein kinase [Thermoanaerobaculia bacterium]|nr:protein kinase [Thermoanaerobaculia bacterium]